MSIDFSNYEQLNNIIDDYITNYFIKNNIDISDYKIKTTLRHSTINNLFRYIYNDLFKSNIYKPYTHNSLIDYNNIELLLFFANKFIDICTEYNKSLGLISFGYFIGVDCARLQEWLSAEGVKLNPARAAILRKLQEEHKAQHIALLNDSGIGLMAVANNDVETGLNWQEKQSKTIQENTIFLLPSERVDRLRIENAAAGAPQGNKV